MTMMTTTMVPIQRVVIPQRRRRQPIIHQLSAYLEPLRLVLLKLVVLPRLVLLKKIHWMLC